MTISSTDGTVTLFDETNIGKITFGVSCSPTYSVNSFAQARLSPARAGSYGGAGFGGSPFGFGQVVLFTQSSIKGVYADITVSYCSARAVISIDRKPNGSVLSRPAAKQNVVCTASGAAYCEKAT